MKKHIPFLDTCITDIIAKHGTDFKNTLWILPNKRPIIFIKKYLSNHISQACFLPKFHTIQDFFDSRTTRSKTPHILLIHTIYTLYVKHTGSKETFEEFYSWGEMMLNDFNDIDTYNITHKDMFANLSAIKEFSNTFDYLNEEQIQLISRFWDTTKHIEKSEIQSKFITIWQSLQRIYDDLQTILDNQNQGYQGKIVREIIRNPTHFLDIDSQTKVFFIGFNALNTCEIALFDYFKQRNQAYFYWDYDMYYASKTHEAGYFISKNIAQFGNELSAEHFKAFKDEKEITIIEAPNPIAQVKECKHILESNTSEHGAIILADEQLLIPLIHAIPHTEPYNISLGFPLKHTKAWSVFEAILNLNQFGANGSFYTKHVYNLFSQTTIRECFPEASKYIQEKISSYNFPYISLSSIVNDNQCLKTLCYSTKKDYLDFLLQTIRYITTHATIDKVDTSIWYAIYGEIEVLQSLICTQNIEQVSVKFLNSILTKTILSTSVPIAGEPLQGMQIMGILETRLLDFESVTILSVNENILPKKSPGSSFIPYSLRIAFGMPTIKEHNAIFAYYFYRIIQRARTITLLYSTQGDDKGISEQSRYITQLIYEFSNYNPLARISKKHIVYPIAPQKNIQVHCSKHSKEYLGYIEQLTSGNKAISPTSLYKYIVCPLQFYFSSILNIRKPQEILALPDDREYGNYFHKAMEEIYTPYINKEVTSQTISTLLGNTTNIKAIVHSAIAHEHKTLALDIDNKTIQLQANIIKKYIANMLAFDTTQAPFTLVGLESTIRHTFTIGEHQISIQGIADRIQSNNNTISILDYKTGKNKLKCPSIESLFDGSYANANSAIFQICLYAYILQVQNPQKSIVPQLLFIRDLHKTSNTRINLSESKTNIENFEEIFETYEQHLFDTLYSLLSPDVSFTQTSDEKHCTYCDYAIFCKKS